MLCTVAGATLATQVAQAAPAAAAGSQQYSAEGMLQTSAVRTALHLLPCHAGTMHCVAVA